MADGISYKDILEQLKGEILGGKYSSSRRLPSSTALARRFNATRFTIRQALDRLRQEGLIVAQKGSGTFVSRQARSRLVGVVIPGISYSSEFFQPIVASLIQCAHERDYTILMEGVWTPNAKNNSEEALALMKGGEKEAAVAKFESVWGSMADAGVDTYWESWDCSESECERYAFYNRPFGRSLCHAWSSGPVFLIPGVFLGIEPGEDGWRKAIRRPYCAEFAPDAEVIVPTPDGPKTFKTDAAPKPSAPYIVKPCGDGIPVIKVSQ